MTRDDELEMLHLIDEDMADHGGYGRSSYDEGDDKNDLVGRPPTKAAKPVKKVARVKKKAAPKKAAKRPAAKKPAPRTNAIMTAKPRGRPRKNPI